MSPAIVLTGATGFLGSHLCRALLAAGYTVHGYRRMSSDPSRLRDITSRLCWHRLPEELEAPFRGKIAPVAVIHCAGLYGRRGETAEQMREANIELPVRLHRLAAECGVPVFLHTDTILSPELNEYAAGKHEAATRLKNSGRSPRVVNLRVHHFYGPDDDQNKFIAALIARCLANEAEIPLTAGQQKRDFIHVDDVARAFVAVLQQQLEAGECGVVEFEVGSGKAVELRWIVERIHALTRSRARLVFGALPYRAHESMFAEADTAALRALGWQPRISLEEGLERTVAAVMEEQAKL